MGIVEDAFKDSFGITSEGMNDSERHAKELRERELRQALVTGEVLGGRTGAERFRYAQELCFGLMTELVRVAPSPELDGVTPALNRLAFPGKILTHLVLLGREKMHHDLGKEVVRLDSSGRLEHLMDQGSHAYSCFLSIFLDALFAATVTSRDPLNKPCPGCATKVIADGVKMWAGDSSSSDTMVSSLVNSVAMHLQNPEFMEIMQDLLADAPPSKEKKNVH